LQEIFYLLPCPIELPVTPEGIPGRLQIQRNKIGKAAVQEGIGVIE